MKRDAIRFRGFRRLQNGDVVATRQIAPCRRVIRDVNGVVLFAEHLLPARVELWLTMSAVVACMIVRRLSRSRELSLKTRNSYAVIDNKG